MKKSYTLLVTIMLSIIILMGCSINKTRETQKIEGETVEKSDEVDPSLMTDQSQDIASTVTAPAVTAPTATAPTVTADMNDLDALYEFFTLDYPNLSRDDFNFWKVYQMDITGNGSDEAVFVGYQGLEWPQMIQIISGDIGKYQRIPSNIEVAKYDTLPAMKDGFFTITTSTGGTGEMFYDLSIYVCHDGEIVPVLQNLTLEHTVQFYPDTDYTEIGTMEGDLTDFTYTLTKTDNITKEITELEKTLYTYQADSLSYQKSPMQTETDN